jgi:hypothetical protein
MPTLGEHVVIGDLKTSQLLLGTTPSSSEEEYGWVKSHRQEVGVVINVSQKVALAHGQSVPSDHVYYRYLPSVAIHYFHFTCHDTNENHWASINLLLMCSLFVAPIIKAFETKGLVYLHCSHGLNRSVSMAVMYAMVKGRSFEDAFKEATGYRKRDIINNPSFRHYIKDIFGKAVQVEEIGDGGAGK